VNSCRPNIRFQRARPGGAHRGSTEGNTLSQTNSISEATTRLIVVVSLVATVFGRALSIALPGSHTGLGQLLVVNRFLGGGSSQLLAVLLVLAVGRLAVSHWIDPRLPVAHRLMVAPAAVLVAMLLVAASCDALLSPYTPEISLIMGIAATLVAIDAIGPCLTPTRLRSSGLVLMLVTVASVAQIAARLLALQASGAALPRQYALARGLATAASALDAIALILVMIWLVSHWQRAWLTIIGAFALAALLRHLSQRGSLSGAGYPAVLTSRALAQLRREPGPWLSAGLQNVHEVLALLIAAVLLARPRGVGASQRYSVAMVLLARSSPDIPLCAGLLVTGALGLLRSALDSVDASPNSDGIHSVPAGADSRAT